MTGQRRFEETPRTVRLTDGVRLERERGRIAIRAQIFRGEVHLATEDVYLSIDDASVMNAQLTRALDQYSHPSLQEHWQQLRRKQWSP